MNHIIKPLIGAAFALAFMGTAAYAAGGGGAGGTTAPNASANPGSAQTPKPASTSVPSSTTQQHVMTDPAPGEHANPPHIVQRNPPRTKTHATTSPNGNSNPG